ncbi:hypothetical protein MUO14_23770 [Halobacillus shinanisalinarum]|uniref:Uncharacterized protein n=1 Tax=Halobacillus shinanisalinarum TaxID=2932258 RepID=A0ABY4GZ66_9BACI|nr:hypothetical protein [Halobacillus shinanisalinarum]UOQ93354.1 hypothetical protein MUO14_23770 [Halobacillus shinanisalinarum]
MHAHKEIIYIGGMTKFNNIQEERVNCFLEAVQEKGIWSRTMAMKRRKSV